jgi:hypothetical protein
MWINSIETAVSHCAAEYLRKTAVVMLTQLDNVMLRMLTGKPALDLSEDLCVCVTETAYSRVFLEKLILLQIIKKFPTRYKTRKVMTVLTRARHSSLSCARWAQSTLCGLLSYKYLPSCPCFYKIRQFIWYSWIISLFKFEIWSLVSKQIYVLRVFGRIFWSEKEESRGGWKNWLTKSFTLCTLVVRSRIFRLARHVTCICVSLSDVSFNIMHRRS